MAGADATAADRPGGTAPHVVVDDVDLPRLSEAQRHHLARVRRIRDGDPLTVTDGRGRWRWCRFGADLEVAGSLQVDPDPEPPVTVAFALVKGERPELVVQKLTELGVDVIVPFVAERSVVRWDGAKAARQEQRLRSIAEEAATQCRRTWLPTVEPVRSFAEVAALPMAVRADRDGPPPGLDRPVVLIGPEGGWSSGERAALEPTVGLGPTVLRAETAAIVAGALLCSLRSGVVRPI